METSKNLLPTPKAGSNSNWQWNGSRTKKISSLQECIQSSQGDSPASLFPKPDEERARKITATSGQRCFELYSLKNRTGSSLKTCVGLLLGMKAWYSNKKDADKYSLKKPYENNFPKTFNPLGRTKRTIWKIATQPYADAHFATFPEKLITIPILAGCPKEICKKCGKAREKILKDTGERTWTDTRDDVLKSGTTGLSFGRNAQIEHIGWIECNCKAGWEKGIVLDPFAGSGTTLRVAMDLGRDYVGIELNPEYVEKQLKKRISQQVLEF